MFKTFERTERTPPDITGQGTESPDEKRTKNGYERTRTDKTIFYLGFFFFGGGGGGGGGVGWSKV